jgi:hypothetical protein
VQLARRVQQRERVAIRKQSGYWEPATTNEFVKEGTHTDETGKRWTTEWNKRERG